MGMTLKGEVSIGDQGLQSIVLKKCSGDSFKFKRLEWGRPLNVEFRGQGFQSNYFYIYEFMVENQDAAATGKEEDKE
jgi:hypothetical protein